jgi:hypothetical protein
LADGLLLVFKPNGHREDEHAHAYAQRLRVLRGELEIVSARSTVVLGARSPARIVAAGCKHRTTALADTWLVAEALAAPARSATAVAPPSARSARAAGHRHRLRVPARAKNRSR